MDVKAKLKPAKPKITNLQPVKPASTPKQVNGLTSVPYRRCFLYGSALVAAEIEDADFCVHGPQGCMSAVQEAFAVQGAEYDYHQSGMTQTEIIFGGERCLTKALVEALHPYEKIGPKFMVSSCASEIIGDNMDKVAALVNPKIPLVKVDGGGFKGDQYLGVEKTLLALVQKFATKRHQADKFVNLIGPIGLTPTWRADTLAIGRLLEELGLQVNYLGCQSNISHFEQAGSAKATVLLLPTVGCQAATFLKQKFGIPFVWSKLYLPLGLRGTESWLRSVRTKLGLSESKIERFVNEKENWVRQKLKVGLNQVLYLKKILAAKESSVGIAAEGEIAFSWFRFVSEELEMPVKLVILRTVNSALKTSFNCWQKKLNTNAKLVCQPDWFACEEIIKAEKVKLMLGSSLECSLAKQYGAAGFLITHPNSSELFLAQWPLLGYEGLIYAVEALLNRQKEVA